MREINKNHPLFGGIKNSDKTNVITSDKTEDKDVTKVDNNAKETTENKEIDDVTKNVIKVNDNIADNNRIVINVKNNDNDLKRATVYLNQSQIDRIDKIKKVTGIGKSELIRLLIEEGLNQVKIEL